MAALLEVARLGWGWWRVQGAPAGVADGIDASVCQIHQLGIATPFTQVVLGPTTVALSVMEPAI